MAKAPFEDYRREIEFQRRTWKRKAVLRTLYRHWYAKIVAELGPRRPVVEIGAGCGNFKDFFPDCIATDVFASGPWIDRVMDAQELQFSPGEVGNFVVFDCLHHLQRPLKFLRQAAEALQPGGRLVACEPAITPFSRLVYGQFHHERIDLAWDLFANDPLPPEDDPGHTFVNTAIPELLFWRQRRRTLELVPQFKLLSARKFAGLLYPLTGGFSYRSLVPQAGFKAALVLEDFLLAPFASWLTGMRMLVVLERV